MEHTADALRRGAPVSAPGVREAPQRTRLRPTRWLLLAAVPLALGASRLLLTDVFVAPNRASSSRLSFRSSAVSKTSRSASVADPVNNVAPEIDAEGQKYARRFEAIFLKGKQVWDHVKKISDGRPKMIYLVGPPGNAAPKVAESLAEALGYVPAADGTMYMNRRPGQEYPEVEFFHDDTERMVRERSPISSVDVYMEDEEKYLDLEFEAIKEFASKDWGGLPAVLAVADTALQRQEIVDYMKQGIIVYLDIEPEYSWYKVQIPTKTNAGIMAMPVDRVRPPPWALANGWDEDPDDTEAKSEYKEIVEQTRAKCEEIADFRLRTDVAGIVENDYWAVERIVKLFAEMYGLLDDAASVEEEVIAQDMEKFLEGARLSKYLKAALDWCEEQGAASIEDVVENVPEFAEALALKPLERKRLDKAAQAVVL